MSVFREQLESLDLRVKGVTQLRSGRVTPSHTPLYLIGGVGDCSVQSAITHLTLRPASVGGVVRGSERPTGILTLPSLQTHTA